MSWAGVLQALQADLGTAAASLTPPIPANAIGYGEPSNVSLSQIGYWYLGDRESTTGGNTAGGVTNIEEGLIVRIYASPNSFRAPIINTTLDTWLRSATRAVKSALWGDFTLGGNAIGLKLDDTQASWETMGSSLVRCATFQLWIDEAGVDTIAP